MLAYMIMEKVRHDIKDLSKVSVSDYEIYEAINEALRILAETTKDSDIPIFRKEALLTITNGRCELPGDFIQMDKVLTSSGEELLRVLHDSDPGELEYNIVGVDILSGESTLKIWYHGYITGITSSSETAGSTDIDIPAAWLLPVSQMAALSIAGNKPAMTQIASIFCGLNPIYSSGQKQ